MVQVAAPSIVLQFTAYRLVPSCAQQPAGRHGHDAAGAVSGTGYMGGKLFGFASCERAVGAAEGMNVLAERRVPSVNRWSKLSALRIDIE